MFWGIVLEPGVKYKTSVEKATRISNAALAYKSPDDKAAVKVHYAGMEFILCHLDGKNTRNTIVDVAFEKGEEIVLVSDGCASVHLTGLTEEEDDEDSIMFDSDEEEAAMQPISKKRKGSEFSPKESPANAKRSRKAEMNKSTTEDDEDEDEDDSDFAFGDDSDEDDDELGEEEDDLESFDEDAEMDDEDDLDDDDEEEEEKPTPLKKDKKGAQLKPAEKNKQQKKQQTASPADQKKPAEAAVNGTEQEGKKKKKKKKNKKNKENKEGAVETQKATPSPAKGTPGKEPATKTENKKGVVVTTLKAGTGPVAKNGKTVHVYYRGRLKSNNKEFDKVVDGKGFAFRLGGGEVIKGWDIGVEGMKVGEKRRLVVPANHAYGPKGVKPDIPPNATLVFDVELKAMS